MTTTPKTKVAEAPGRPYDFETATYFGNIPNLHF